MEDFFLYLIWIFGLGMAFTMVSVIIAVFGILAYAVWSMIHD